MVTYCQNSSPIQIRQHYNQTEHILIQGNNNNITIANSNCIIELMGNGNIVNGDNSMLRMEISGNGNQLVINQCHVQLRVLGNANEIRSEQEIQPIKVHECRGFGNVFPSNAIQPPSQSFNTSRNNSNNNIFQMNSMNQPFSNPFTTRVTHINNNHFNSTSPFANNPPNIFAPNNNIFSNNHVSNPFQNSEMRQQMDEEVQSYNVYDDDDFEEVNNSRTNDYFVRERLRAQEMAQRQAQKAQEEVRKAQMEARRIQEQQRISQYHMRIEQQRRKAQQQQRRAQQQYQRAVEEQRRIFQQQRRRAAQLQRNQQQFRQAQQQQRHALQYKRKQDQQSRRRQQQQFRQQQTVQFNQGRNIVNWGPQNIFNTNNNPFRVHINNLPVENNVDDEDRGLNEAQIKRLIVHNYTGPQQECSICFLDMEYNDETTFLHCFHSFHSYCINSWLKKSPKCPICNQNVRKNL